MVDFREYMQLRERKRREMQEKLREMQDKRREIIEETIRRDFEEKERNTGHKTSVMKGDRDRMRVKRWRIRTLQSYF